MKVINIIQEIYNTLIYGNQELNTLKYILDIVDVFNHNSQSNIN